MRLGIDFGTTRTVVAAVHDGRHPVASYDEDGEYKEYVPGVAAVVDGQLIVGWDAARAIADGSAEHAIRSIKRVISSLAPDQPVPELPSVTALELATLFLRDLRRVLVERSNLELDPNELFETMVAVPASAPSRQRWLTLEAFRRSGFQPIGLVNEPTAAAIELAHLHLSDHSGLRPRTPSAGKRRSPKKYVVVYDLGGGTFDCSAVSLEGQRFDLIASEGLMTLGGDDFDALICDLAGIVPTPQALERAREAKESLRSTSKKLLLEDSEGDSVAIEVAELYARAQPLIDQTIRQVEQLFERLVERGIDPEDPRELGGVYLVGGGVAFPAVGRTLRERFGKKLQLAPQPFAATAVGLAIAADPAQRVIVREAITRHFGVWREADNGTDKVFDSLIGKNSDLPVVTRRYRPTHAVGHLRFLECGALDDAGQPIQDLVPCADVYFPYDPSLDGQGEAELASVPNDRRTVKGDEIAETYTYSTDGTISVRIENVSRGYGRTFTIGALR